MQIKIKHLLFCIFVLLPSDFCINCYYFKIISCSGNRNYVVRNLIQISTQDMWNKLISIRQQVNYKLLMRPLLCTLISGEIVLIKIIVKYSVPQMYPTNPRKFWFSTTVRHYAHTIEQLHGLKENIIRLFHSIQISQLDSWLCLISSWLASSVRINIWLNHLNDLTWNIVSTLQMLNTCMPLTWCFNKAVSFVLHLH